MRLTENEGEYGFPAIAAQQAHIAAVHTHNLAGEAQTYSGALGFGGKEWHKYLFLTLRAYRRPVVAHVDDHAVVSAQVRSQAYVLRTSLHGVAY